LVLLSSKLGLAGRGLLGERLIGKGQREIVVVVTKGLVIIENPDLTKEWRVLYHATIDI
jgi:hypothetical protein